LHTQAKSQPSAKGSEIEVGAPQHLFHAGTPGIGVTFDVSSDRKCLLVNHAEEEAQAPLQLITDWTAELKNSGTHPAETVLG